MVTAPTLMSLAEYLHTARKPDAHFVEGELEERNVGKYDHSTVQLAIGSFLWSRRREWSIHPMTEQRLQVSPGCIRVCDVVVLRADALREEVTLSPPLICIEVLSPDDRLSRSKLVLADYQAMGVANIWLIDPIYRCAFTFDSAGLHEADAFGLTVPGTPIRLDLSEAFEALD